MTPYFIIAPDANRLHKALACPGAPTIRIILAGVAIVSVNGFIGGDPLEGALQCAPGFHAVCHVLKAPSANWLRKNPDISLIEAADLAKRPNADGGMRVH